MKKNFLKFAIYGVSVVLVASSCLKTEELDSVKAMRDAKADKLKADAVAANLKNAYDSANYKINLTVSTAQSQYNIANYSFQTQMLKLSYSSDSLSKALGMLKAKAQNDYDLAMLTAKTQGDVAQAKAVYDAQVAYQESLQADYNRQKQSSINQMNQSIQDAKNMLLAAQVTFVNNQSFLLVAKQNLLKDSINALSSLYLAKQNRIKDSINALSSLLTLKQNYTKDSINIVSKNQALTNLYNDYFGYYNGNTTLSTGVYISKGIFTLRGDILAEKTTLLNSQNTQANDIETKANLILSHRDKIRTDSLAIVADQKTITIYQNAKNAADYTDAINDITSLVNSAEIDFVSKQNARALLEEPKAKTHFEDSLATDAYDKNIARRTSYKTAMNKILTLYGVTTYNDLVQKQGRLATNLSDTSSYLNDKATVFNTWSTKLSTAIANLNISKNTKNQAQARSDAADAVIASVTAAGGIPTAAQLTEQTNAANALIAANTDLTDKQNIYNAVKAGYDPAQTAYEGAKTAYSSAKDANDSIIARRGRYDAASTVYDECDGKVAALLATKDAKHADYMTALNQYNNASTAEKIAKNTYVYYKTCKTTLEGIALVSDASVKMSQLDDKIAAAQKDIATLNNDIADYQLQISRINKADYSYVDAIATSNAKIAMMTSLLTEYEANATAIKAKIDAY